MASCQVCSSSCTLVDRSGAVCGDGVVDVPDETCDDGNADACGSCSASCQTVQSGHASGLIVAASGASIADGETLAIADGLGGSLVLEFDKDFFAFNQPLTITNADTPSMVAKKIADAVNGSLLRVDAVAFGALVELVHQVATSLGNQSIAETVSAPDFYVQGMQGGAGGDCATSVGCTSDGDCASGSCGNLTSQCD
jgi:hypothetical protein